MDKLMEFYQYTIDILGNKVVYYTLFGGLVIVLLSFLTVKILDRYSFSGKFKLGVKRIRRFLDKHLVVSEYNQDEFTAKCIDSMPLQFNSCWKDYITKREGKPSSYFEKALSNRRLMDYSNSYGMNYFKLISYLVGIAFTIVMAYYKVDLLYLGGIMLAYITIYIVLSSIISLSHYRLELGHDRRIHEFNFMIDRFSRFKAFRNALAKKIDVDNKETIVSGEKQTV